MSEPTRAARGRRRGGRDTRRAGVTEASVSAPYVQRKIPVFEVLDEEGLQLIENNADTILEEIGIEFRDMPEALDILKQGGAEIDGVTARFPRGLCRSIIQASAPAEYTQHARNPARSVQIGGKNTVFVPAYGSPFVLRSRQRPPLRDHRRLPEFRQAGLHEPEPAPLRRHHLRAGRPVPVNKRHFDMVYSPHQVQRQGVHGLGDRAGTRPGHRRDDQDPVRRQLHRPETGSRAPYVTSLINANSPMTFDDTMLGAAKVYARNNQATIITPFILAGAMSPVTVAGTAAQIAGRGAGRHGLRAAGATRARR